MSDAEQAHHLTARQRAAVPVQFGDQLGVGALLVHLTCLRLVRRQCSGIGADRCTGSRALKSGWCTGLQCGLVDQGEQRSGHQSLPVLREQAGEGFGGQQPVADRLQGSRPGGLGPA